MIGEDGQTVTLETPNPFRLVFNVITNKDEVIVIMSVYFQTLYLTILCLVCMSYSYFLVSNSTLTNTSQYIIWLFNVYSVYYLKVLNNDNGERCRW